MVSGTVAAVLVLEWVELPLKSEHVSVSYPSELKLTDADGAGKE